MLGTQSDQAAGLNTGSRRRWVAWLGVVAGWGWAIFAGGGGVWYLWTKGPWRLTNGWFALASAISACPLTAWMLNRLAGIVVSWRVQFAFAVLFIIAGKIALRMGI